MRDLMKKSTEMFGARKSVSSLFINRRSTIQKKPLPEIILEEEEKNGETKKKEVLEVEDI